MYPEMNVIIVLWGLLAVVWGTSSLYEAKAIVRTQSPASRLVQTSLLVCGFFLLFKRSTGIQWFDTPIVPQHGFLPWIGVWIVAAGVAFAIWARTTLGGNWSGSATLKAGHTLTRVGPYRLVRHPIYTGILTAMLGTAIASGFLHSILAVPVCILCYWLKIQTEEGLLISQFGQDYVQYRKEAKALIPYLL